MQRRLAALRLFRPHLTLAMYAAQAHEVPTRALFEDAVARGVRCAFPRTVRGDRRLVFHQVSQWSELEPLGRFGLLEPSPTAPSIELEAIEIFLVPGVAFSLDGDRLGRGGGHYDTTLASSPGWRLALAWEASVVETLPREPTDAPMDALVTEARVVVWRGGPG